MKVKKILLFVLVFVIILLGVLIGTVIFGRKARNEKSTVKDYNDCIEIVNRNEEISKEAYEEARREIDRCIRNYIESYGYFDSVNCINDFNNPVCREEKYNEKGENVGRYNIEVLGSNICEKCDENTGLCEGLDELIKQKKIEKGYNFDTDLLKCLDYLK